MLCKCGVRGVGPCFFADRSTALGRGFSASALAGSRGSADGLLKVARRDVVAFSNTARCGRIRVRCYLTRPVVVS